MLIQLDMEKHLISIVTVSYNAAATIEQTILSVINQTYRNIEYIIIDGGSTDGTVEIIKKYANKLAYWVSEPDKGIYDAMNKGIQKAKGEWINFMNAGDILYNSDVLAQVLGTEIPLKTSFIYSNATFIDKNRIYEVEANHEKGYLLHQCCIYRTSLHQKYGCYIVTPTIIISDAIFFYSIPDEYFKKTSVKISINTLDGISSQNSWCENQLQCLRFIYRKMSLAQLIIQLFKVKFKHIFPLTFKLIKQCCIQK